MDKSALGVVGLVAGILGLLVGGTAYMQASKAMSKAGEAQQDFIDAQEAEEEERAKAASDAVKVELSKTRDEVMKMVEEVKTKIRELERQATRVDILTEAKSHAEKNAARSSQNLFEQVRALQKEIATGDGTAKRMVEELEAKVDRKISETREMLKRLVTRWMESGVM